MAAGSVAVTMAMAIPNTRISRTAAAIALLAAIVAAILPCAVLAAESQAVESTRDRVTLISDADRVSPGETFMVGLRLKLAPHWHTYWVNPGDAGSSPDITLTLPPGATTTGILWPGPDAITIGPARNFGYADEIVLPLKVQVPKTVKPGEHFPIRAEASWLVCEKVCIPEQGIFALDLPIAAGTTPASADIAAAFAIAEARMPAPLPWPARLTVEGTTLLLDVEGADTSPARLKSAFFFPASWGVLVHAAPQRLSVGDGRLTLALEIGPTFDRNAPIAGVLALTDANNKTRWFALSATVAPASGAENAVLPQTPAAEPVGWQTLLFAFLGGLLLNLMPCVFPVLAMKATAVARLSGGERRQVRLSGLAYSLGVLVAFLTLAAILLALRAGGSSLGWGFQFQSPLFVVVLCWLILAIGLNLSGVYEIGTSLTGAGQTLASRPGHAGSFFTGLLAVVVATPCTAPFMGAALGAALTASPMVCLALFATLGLGLAAPFALISLFPGLAGVLPRPGVWMLRLRQALAFPMYATAAWLVWVLTQQVGDVGVMIALSGGLLVALAAWTCGIAQAATGRPWLARGGAIVALMALAALLPQLHGLPAPDSTAASAESEAFTNARLATLRRDGKPVFVNMTAAWCITCLVNDRTALSTAAVRKAMRAGGVAYLKGDWTNGNPEITSFLKSFVRDGVPFNVFYPAGGGNPVVLPSVLTEGTVLTVLRQTAAR